MFEHVTVLKEEAIAGLNISPDGIYVDCTLGGGGHSSRILEQLTTGHLYAFDQDQNAIDAATKRLDAISDHYTIIHDNFKNIKSALEAHGVTKVDGILYDLGVSSPQFDQAERGFSYNLDARLDMRMDQRQSLDAWQIVNTWDYNEIVKILFRYSDEKFAKQIARRIEQQRAIKPIDTTFELVEIIKEAIPAKARRTGGHPAKRTFQALRIAVNDELHVLEDSLQDAFTLLKPHGRIAVITFHSLEDRITKQMFKEKTTPPPTPRGLPVVGELKTDYELVNKKPIVASEKELDDNHRSHSAKLRIIERNETNES